MKRSIKLYEKVYCLDETSSLAQMKEECPMFFKTKFGKRETYAVYRGCLIVRHTQEYSDRSSNRKTLVYAYFPDFDGRPDMFCLNLNCLNVRHAKTYINACIKQHRMLKNPFKEF